MLGPIFHAVLLAVTLNAFRRSASVRFFAGIAGGVVRILLIGAWAWLAVPLLFNPTALQPWQGSLLTGIVFAGPTLSFLLLGLAVRWEQHRPLPAGGDAHNDHIVGSWIGVTVLDGIGLVIGLGALFLSQE